MNGFRNVYVKIFLAQIFEPRDSKAELISKVG